MGYTMKQMSICGTRRLELRGSGSTLKARVHQGIAVAMITHLSAFIDLHHASCSNPAPEGHELVRL